MFIADRKEKEQCKISPSTQRRQLSNWRFLGTLAGKIGVFKTNGIEDINRFSNAAVSTKINGTFLFFFLPPGFAGARAKTYS
jgi:hypothetical protein